MRWIESAIGISMLAMCLVCGAKPQADTTAVPCVRHVESLVYEPIARLTGIKGDVVLQIQIDQAGDVGQMQLISGHPLLAKQAENNLKSWQFISGAATTLTVKYEFRFAGAPADREPISIVSFDLPYRVRVTSRPPRIDHGPGDSLP